MVNFKLVSPFSLVQRRSFDYGTPAELSPTNANPLVDGEWLELNASYQMDRGTLAGALAINPAWPVFSEQGRYDTQALGKVNMLYGGWFEADTLVYTAGALQVGDRLTVSNVTFGGQTRRGLIEFNSGGFVVGYVTRIVAGGYLRFIRAAP